MFSELLYFVVLRFVVLCCVVAVVLGCVVISVMLSLQCCFVPVALIRDLRLRQFPVQLRHVVELGRNPLNSGEGARSANKLHAVLHKGAVDGRCHVLDRILQAIAPLVTCGGDEVVARDAMLQENSDQPQGNGHRPIDAV